VVDAAGGLLGIVSEIDLLRGTVPPDPVAHLVPVAADGGTAPTVVADVMTRDVQVLQPHSDLHDAARSMRASGIRSLPVVHGSTVVGVVSRSDLLRVLARGDDEVSADLQAALGAELGPHHDVHAEVVGGMVRLSSADAAALAAARIVAARVPGVVRVEASGAAQH
jgi:Mg/Co/Ni transporter MgtE